MVVLPGKRERHTVERRDGGRHDRKKTRSGKSFRQAFLIDKSRTELKGSVSRHDKGTEKKGRRKEGVKRYKWSRDPEGYQRLQRE